MLYACDETWWIHHFPLLATHFQGELWTIAEGARERFDLRWIYGADMGGLSRDPSMIHTGKNSGTQAIGLAHCFGAQRIVLVGFDMQRTDNKSHWHGDHPKGLGNGSLNRYGAWMRGLELVAEDCKRLRLEVVNASRRTAMRSFPRVTIEDALR